MCARGCSYYVAAGLFCSGFCLQCQKSWGGIWSGGVLTAHSSQFFQTQCHSRSLTDLTVYHLLNILCKDLTYVYCFSNAKMLNLIKMCVLFRECTSVYLLQSRKWQECAVFLFSATLKTFIANSVQAIDSESAHSWRCKKAAECSACTVWVKQQLGNRWSVCHRAPCPLTQVWKAGKTTETQRRPVLWGLNRNMKG